MESRDRFAAFAARKTAAALSATPAPYVTVLERPAGPLTPMATPWSRAAFGGVFYVREPTEARAAADARPACSLVFVRSADGNTAADDPATLGGGATDFHVVYEGLSRVAAGAVLVGAKTVNSASQIFSVWHPEMIALRQSLGYARHPTQIVATRRGMDLTRGLLFNVPDVPVVLLTGSAAARAMEPHLAARPWIRCVVSTDLAAAFATLRAEGIHRISCIGGRSLAADLLDRRLADDLYLTTAAHTGGVPGTPLPPAAFAGQVIVEKRGTGEDAGVTFQHIDLRTR